jgi:hypothetical protein
MLNRAFLLLIVAAACVGLLVYSRLQTEPLAVSGFLESYEIRIGSRVGGLSKTCLLYGRLTL